MAGKSLRCLLPKFGFHRSFDSNNNKKTLYLQLNRFAIRMMILFVESYQSITKINVIYFIDNNDNELPHNV